VKLTLGFSPCPNDTFIFDALVNGKIDTQGLEFDVVLEDVQTLNEWATAEKLDITKMSYGVLPKISNTYIVLNSGSALGKGVGPLLVSRNDITGIETPLSELTIAIPGADTTAHFLFSKAFPSARNKKFMVFNQVEEAVLNGTVDAGVIIHENRFTYQEKGLIKVIDLGDHWEKETGLAIPLGGIAAKRSLPVETIKQVDELIKQSVEFAFSNYPVLPTYVKQHAQEMDENVMRQHIDLYVNDYSIDLGKDGKEAIEMLLHSANFKNEIELFA
jgi:1,4-dihydroxy-6-naphthoate synthase